MSHHLEAAPGAIAEKVLLPGDPLRARYIAQHYLTEVTCYNEVRNALGYTGLYRGERVSVQGTGMGIPSISIYAHELMAEYAVQTLIRVGTAGAISPRLHVRDVVLAQGAGTDSSLILSTFGPGIYFAPLADFDLLKQADQWASTHHIPYYVGNVLGEDRFYNDEIDRSKLVEYGAVAIDMEAPALYLLAAKFKRRALTVLTISNHLVTGDSTNAQEREQSFDDMIKLALALK